MSAERAARMLVLFGVPWTLLVFAALPLTLWRYLLVLTAALALVLASRLEEEQ